MIGRIDGWEEEAGSLKWAIGPITMEGTLCDRLAKAPTGGTRPSDSPVEGVRRTAIRRERSGASGIGSSKKNIEK